MVGCWELRSSFHPFLMQCPYIPQNCIMCLMHLPHLMPSDGSLPISFSRKCSYSNFLWPVLGNHNIKSTATRIIIYHTCLNIWVHLKHVAYITWNGIWATLFAIIAIAWVAKQKWSCFTQHIYGQVFTTGTSWFLASLTSLGIRFVL